MLHMCPWDRRVVSCAAAGFIPRLFLVISFCTVPYETVFDFLGLASVQITSHTLSNVLDFPPLVLTDFFRRASRSPCRLCPPPPLFFLDSELIFFFQSLRERPVALCPFSLWHSIFWEFFFPGKPGFTFTMVPLQACNDLFFFSSDLVDMPPFCFHVRNRFPSRLPPPPVLFLMLKCLFSPSWWIVAPCIPFARYYGMDLGLSPF